MTAENTRYVSWKDARAAVEGHEVEIVNALGIPWRAGQRDHIRCPYRKLPSRDCLQKLRKFPR